MAIGRRAGDGSEQRLIFGRHWPAAVTWSIFLLLAAAIPLIASYALEAPMIRLEAHWAESLRVKMPAAEAKAMEP